MQKGGKPGSKGTKRLAKVQQGNIVADNIKAGRTFTPSPPAAPPEAAGGKKRGKEYVPKKGSANEAFLICMFQAAKLNKPVFGKQELMQAAEASGIADKSIYGDNVQSNIAAGNYHKAYDGWSSMKVRTAC